MFANKINDQEAQKKKNKENEEILNNQLQNGDNFVAFDIDTNQLFNYPTCNQVQSYIIAESPNTRGFDSIIHKKPLHQTLVFGRSSTDIAKGIIPRENCGAYYLGGYFDGLNDRTNVTCQQNSGKEPDVAATAIPASDETAPASDETASTSVKAAPASEEPHLPV